MDEQENQNSIFSQVCSSKKALRILLSLSLLAFISSPYFSQLSSSLSSIKLFTSSSSRSDRPYIFLLCNGIMLLVFKSSGLFAPPTATATATTTTNTEFSQDIRKNVQLSDHQPTDFNENIHVKKKVLSHHRFNTTGFKKNYDKLQIHHVLETKTDTNTALNEVQYVTPTTYNDKKEASDDLLKTVHECENYQQEQGQEEFININKEGDQGMILWSTEELNKKCDDFIRKMKHGIKFESQLVMA